MAVGWLRDSFRQTYYIGGKISASAILYDGYGKRKYSGGDQIRATIECNTLHASAPCVVTDNMDGTHAIICEALWSGDSTIKVTLAYTREAVTSLYRIRTKVLATRNIYGRFRFTQYTEATICHLNVMQLLRLTNYTEVCNMTYLNSGMPFYCGKPNNVHLLCEDLEKVKFEDALSDLPLTKCERTLRNRGQRSFTHNVSLTIKGSNEIKNTPIAKPSIPCSEYNISLTWHSRQPSGFFYKGHWMLRHCRVYKEITCIPCLKGRRLYMLGDSTTRQWYFSVVKRFRCQPVTGKLLSPKWQRTLECYNKELDFHAGWYPHSQPFYAARNWNSISYNMYSISRRIDNIPQDTRAIVLVHLYVHVVPFHHNEFKQRMEIIRLSIKRFLTKSRNSVVMIKGPHTFDDRSQGVVWVSDYYGYVYSKILYEVFDELHDKVILLNNRDATLAEHTTLIHPGSNIVDAMVDQMFSFACK